MKPSKEFSVRGLVLSVLVVVALLGSIAITLNRVFNTSTSYQGLANLASLAEIPIPHNTTAQESTPVHCSTSNSSSSSTESSRRSADLHENSTSPELKDPSKGPNGNQTESESLKLQETPKLPIYPEESVSKPSATQVEEKSDEEPLSSDDQQGHAASLSHPPVFIDEHVDRSVVLKQRVFQPASQPHYLFVKFSAYRLSLRTIFVTGISSHVARAFDHDKIARTCEWHPAKGKHRKAASDFKVTEAQMIYVKGDENKGTYSPAVINCTFPDDVGADGRGGVLVLQISTGYNRWAATLSVVAMEEQPGDVDVVMHPPQEFPYRFAFCGAPIHGKVRGDWLLQWMTYHHYLGEGKTHFFFYNLGGMLDKDRPLFQKYLDAGLMSITDLVDPNLSDYPTWYHHQVLLINDCLHRSRFMAEHVFFFDYDELLEVPTPNNLTGLLQRNKDAPWISFGSIYANTKNCRWPRTGKSESPLGRMLWRRPAPECRHRGTGPIEDPWDCLGPMGRRKYVVNPRKVFAAGVHGVTIPEFDGINLNAREARMLHYRGAPRPGSNLCGDRVDLSKGDEKEVLHAGWIQDANVSLIFDKAIKFPVRSVAKTKGRS